MSAELQHAAEHLQRLGYQLLGHDQRTRFGSIDLIAYDGSTIVFATVTRTTDTAAADDAKARAAIRRRAVAWLQHTQECPRGAALRFDHLLVRVDSSGALLAIEHGEGAF